MLSTEYLRPYMIIVILKNVLLGIFGAIFLKFIIVYSYLYGLTSKKDNYERENFPSCTDCFDLLMFHIRNTISEQQREANILLCLLVFLFIIFLVLHYLCFRLEPPLDILAYINEKKFDWEQQGDSAILVKIKIEFFYLNAYYGTKRAEIEDLFL